MKITVYSYKGGVGKTRISLNLALTLDFGVITNDVLSPIENILPKGSLLKLAINQKMPQLPKNADIIFDLGGYPDERAISALKQSACVLVPVILDQGDLQVTLNFINEIEDFNRNIIILANRTAKGDLEEIKKVMNKFFPKYPIFEIKETRAMPNILIEKKSVKDMANEGGIKKYHYAPVVKQFDEIIKHIFSKFE